MIDESLFLKFCAPRGQNRDAISAPFSDDDYIYATDGRVCVRVNKTTDKYDGNQGLIIETVHRLFSVKLGTPFEVPDVEAPSEPCTHCIDGEVMECGDCDGDGYLEFRSDYGHDYTVDCEECAGDGTNRPRSSNEDKLRCGFCDGGGRVFRDEQATEVGGQHFDTRYLLKLKQLPEIKLYPDKECEPARFTFDGGDGVLMSLRKD